MNRRSAVVAVLAAVAVGVTVLAACWPFSPTPRPWTALPTPTLRPPPATASLAWGLAHGVPCEAPCWEGLTPGVSTLEEVLQTMERLRQRDQVTFAECKETFCSVLDQNDTWVAIRIGDDGKVGLIWGGVAGRQYAGEWELSAQQLVERLGEPSWVWTSSASYTQDSLCVCDAAHLLSQPSLEEGGSVGLLYLDRGASFYLTVPPEDPGCLCPYMKLASFWYFSPVASPSEYAAILEEAPGGGSIREAELVSWRGWGAGYLTRPDPLPTASLAWGLAYDEPCPPPCWEGLTPGVSTLEEVLQTMERLRQRDQMRYAECYEGVICNVKEEYATSVEVRLGNDGKVGFISGLVPAIRYEGEELSVQQIIDRFGEPSWVWTWAATEGEPSPPCACDAVHLLSRPEVGGDVELIYLQRGISFAFDVPPEDSGCICPYMKMTGFDYFPPVSSLDEYSNVLIEYHQISQPIPKRRVVPWHGLGPGYPGTDD